MSKIILQCKGEEVWFEVEDSGVATKKDDKFHFLKPNLMVSGFYLGSRKVSVKQMMECFEREFVKTKAHHFEGTSVLFSHPNGELQTKDIGYMFVEA